MGTTTRILQLIDEKKLNFDTSVSEQVSEFRHPEVTVGYLLLHTSGLQGDFERKGELKDKEDRGMVCGVAHDSKAYLLGESGSAGIFSTLSDLISFVEAYLQRDGRLFSEGMFQTILDTTFKDRGLGWNKEYGNHILYHTGFTGTSILMDMDTREGMILLTNRIHPSRDNKVFLEERIALNHLWLD